MTKRDDGCKDGGHSGKLTWMTSSGTRARFYGGGYPTRNHAPKANALSPAPDKDGSVQAQFDFRPETVELTAEDAAALDFLRKDGEAENTEQVPEAAELTAEEAAALDLLQKEVEAENTEWRSLGPVKRIKLHGIETGASMRIARPPGSLLATISEFVFSKKTLEQIVNPIIADMQKEYCEALAAKRSYKAAWVRVRYCWSFAKALGLYSLLKAVIEMWRKVIRDSPSASSFALRACQNQSNVEKLTKILLKCHLRLPSASLSKFEANSERHPCRRTPVAIGRRYREAPFCRFQITLVISDVFLYILLQSGP